MEMLEDTYLIGYTDDIAAVVLARNVKVAQITFHQGMRRVNSWLEENGLDLATTVIVLLTTKEAP